MKKTVSRNKKNKAPLTPRRRLVLVGFGVFAALALLLVFEGLLALLGLGKPDPHHDPFVGFEGGTGLFEPFRDEAGNAWHRTRPAKLSFFNEQRFPAKKAPGSFRIFMLGGSTTFGRPYDWKVAFPQWSRLLLQAMDPDTEYEVINAGGVSYASYRIAVLLEEILRYEPDLLVIYTGHNEFLEERTYGSLADRPAWMNRIAGAASRTRTLTFLQGLTGRGKPKPENRLTAEVQAKLDVWEGLDAYTRNDSLRRAILSHFELNLERMIRMARGAGVPLVLVTPACNLKDFSPFKSEHQRSVTQEDVEKIDRALDRGLTLMEDSDYPTALRELERVLPIDDEYALLHFRLAQAYFGMGKVKDAKRHFELARDWDICPLRATEAAIDAVRRTAGDHGVPLVDFVQLLEEKGEADLACAFPGKEFFLDHVHPTIEIHQFLAERLVRTLVDKGLTPATGALPEKKEELYDGWRESLDPTYYAHRDLNLAKVLGWAGKVEEATTALLRARELLAGNPDLHFNLGVLYEKQDQPGLARVEYRKAIEAEPTFFEAHLNMGRVSGAMGDWATAERAFREALRLAPDSAETRYNLGQALFHQDRLEEALALFDQRGNDGQSFPGTLMMRGKTLLRMGRIDGAVEALRLQTGREPDLAGAFFYLGLALGQSGDIAGATEALTRAVTLEPHMSEAHRELAHIHESRGEEATAIAAYRRAVETSAEDHLACFELGLLHHKNGRLKEAASWYGRATERNPAFAKGFLNLGAVFGEMGRLDLAIEALGKLLELDPENASAHYNLAQLFLARGNRAEAETHLEKATELGVTPSPAVLEQFKTGGNP